jgi:hypothetical protein
MFSSSSCVSSSEDEGSPLGRVLSTTSLLSSMMMNSTSHSQAALEVESESQPQTQPENGSDGSANVSDADSDYEDARVSARPHIVGGSFLCEMETQAVSDNAMQAHQDQDAELLKCLIKYKKQILQTHWLLVGFAGSELRESTKQFGFKSHEQGSYMLDAYRRWIDLYEAEVPSPPHDPDMFKRPHDVPRRTWQLALMILKTSINRRAGETAAASIAADPTAGALLASKRVTYAFQPLDGRLLVKKFNGDLKKRFVNCYAPIWNKVAPNYPTIPSGKTKWDLLKKMLSQANIKADVKDWFAWVVLGPSHMDVCSLRAPRPVARGGPAANAEAYMARHTAETALIGMTGRRTARALMAGRGRQSVHGGPAVSEIGDSRSSPISQQMLKCQVEKNNMQRQQLEMARIELSTNLISQAIHYASEAPIHEESAEIKAMRFRGKTGS